MLQKENMKKPVEWWHLLFQTSLFVLALAGMLWNFSTSTQESKDDIKFLKQEVNDIEHARHEDAILYRADINELKGKIDDLRVIVQDKKDREK